MKHQQMAKRCIISATGLFFISMGIAFTKHAELGVSPVSSVANVLSCKFESITLGTWLIISNTVLILFQMALLGKSFKPRQLLQFPVSIASGFFTDMCLVVISMINADAYIMRMTLLLAGIATLGLGISMMVIANVVVNPAEGIVSALAFVIKKSFGDVKTWFDTGWVLLALILSLIMFDFNLVGIREGTVIAAIITGYAVKLCNSLLTQPINNWFERQAA